MEGPVAVYEPNFGGHRLSYVRHLVDYCVAEGHSVTVLTSAEGAAACGEELTQAGATVHVVEGVREARREVRRWGSLVVPDGDRAALSAALQLRRPARETYLVMRPNRQAGTATAVFALKNGLLRLARLRGARVLRLVPSTTIGGGADAVRDPVEIHHRGDDVARALVGDRVEGGTPVVGVVGALDARKNCDQVARAVLATRRGVALFAGRQAEATRAGLSAFDPEPRVVQLDRRLGDDELDSFVCLCDVVVIAHANDGASGIYGRALALGTAVVVVGEGAVADDLRRHAANGEVVPGCGAELTAALDRWAGSAPPAVEVATPREFARRLVDR